MPAHTFIATWLAVARCGATVVPVDVDPATLLIDPGRGRGRRDARAPRRSCRCTSTATRPTWTRSSRSPSATACSWSRTPRRPTARASAARAAGSLGDAAAFSFYPGKNLGRVRRRRRRDDRRRRDRRARAAAAQLRLGGPLRARGGRRQLAPGPAPGGVPAREAGRARATGTRAGRRSPTAYLDGLADVPDLDPPAGGDAARPARLAPVLRPPPAPRRAAARTSPAAGVATLVHYPVPPHLLAGLRGPRAGARAASR